MDYSRLGRVFGCLLLVFAIGCERETEDGVKELTEVPDSPIVSDVEAPWTVAFYTSRPVDQCPISVELRTVFLDVAAENELANVEFEDWSSKNGGYVPELPSPFEGPQILVYHDGHPVDRHVGIQHPDNRITAHYTGREFNRGAVLNLLARNHLIETPAEQLIFEGIARSGTDLEGAAVGPYDYRGADLRGAVFVEAKLSGTRFDGADLRDTDFSGAELFGVSFEDADVDGATFVDALVVHSICPDGTPSADDGCDW